MPNLYLHQKTLNQNYNKKLNIRNKKILKKKIKKNRIKVTIQKKKIK